MINLEIIKSVVVPLPAVETQRGMVRDFSATCREIDQLMSLQERARVLLEERKHTLIAAAVTGQFDVTTARAVA